jgi:hypothetical protein
MKLSSIFNIAVDAQDVLDLFDGVDNVDQLRGRLRRLSQIEADDLLTCLQGLQSSVTAALNDTLEMNADLDSSDDELPGKTDLLEEKELVNLASDDLPGEDQSPEPPAPVEK